ncbi:MAG: hypothetical protein HKN93_08435 [Acidimicrobiia bacterium]|nr:hypothetical protein [Acidimicrobiia bacterium]
MKESKLPLTLAFFAALAGCNDRADSPHGDRSHGLSAVDAPLELTPDLCDDPSKIAFVLGSLLRGGDAPSFGKPNPAQFFRMIAAPTKGPFYMVNLIRFRDRAVYADGRQTDLTGREANALYFPIEFIEAIGARIVFAGEVEDTTLGEEGAWDQVAIVEYPCPLALFAMITHPGFRARSVHKDAGVEASIVMVTHLQPVDDVEPTETSFPLGIHDPAFELVRVFRYRERAQHGDVPSKTARTGQEAMDLYASSLREAERQAGFYPKARLTVQGVLIGDGRAWDEVWIDSVRSRAAFDSLRAAPAVVTAEPHRKAALEEAFGVTIDPILSSIPKKKEK